MARSSVKALEAEIEELRLRLEEANGALEAIRRGHVESLVVEGPDGPRIFSLEGASHSYRVLVEAINEGAATLSPEGTILYCNMRLAEMVGEPLERVIGSFLQEWVPASLASAIDGLLKEACDGQSRSELRLRRRGTGDLPVSLSLKTFCDSGRQLLCLVAADLSEQKRNEQILAEGRLAHSVLEQAAEAIVVCDEKGRITHTSRAAEALSGCNPLRAFFDAAFPVMLSSPLLRGDLASTALAGAVTRGEAGTLRRADGTTAQLLVSATPVTGSSGQILGCVVTMVDLTEYRRFEEALRQSREEIRERELHYRTLFETSPSGIVVLDSGGRMMEFNKVAHCQLGYGRDEFAQLSLQDIDVNETAEGVDAHVAAAMANGAALFETRHRTKSGELRDVVVDARVVQLKETRRLICVWRDVTEPKRAEDALREADQNKNHFLATLAHELRNPLAPIRNSLFILDRVVPGGEQATRAKAVLDRQVNHMARLVDDLLDVTRVSRGKIQLQRETLDVREVARRTLEDHRAAFEEAGISLEASLSARTLPMYADATRLAQVVGNLLQNALKFTPRGGHVWASLEHDEPEQTAILRVRDDGCGMDAHTLAHLFHPFSQADRTLDRSHGGLGLGLSLVKGIVELHGGTVVATSEGPGMGAEFTVRVPLQPKANDALTAAFEQPARPVPRRVLVIEDNTDAAETLREVLDFDGHTVELAHTGPDGVAKARTFAPDVVLCDIGLPGVDGYEVARILRSDPRLRSICMVALSGYAGPEDVARSKESGFDRHFAKPPNLEALRQLLAAYPPPVPDAERLGRAADGHPWGTGGGTAVGREPAAGRPAR